MTELEKMKAGECNEEACIVKEKEDCVMKLELYKFETCPFCQRVLREIEAEGRTDIELHDIHKNDSDRERLIRDGGKEQVPCLFIDGEPLYESLDIIDWLKAHPQGVA